MRISSTKSLGNGGWLHDVDGTPARVEMWSHISTPNTIASVEQRDAVYRALGKICELSPAHRRHLTGERGLPEEGVAAGFATVRALDIQDRRALAERIVSQVGGRHDAVSGVPGFYQAGKSWALVRTFSGILVPVPDRLGRIQAYQVRAARPGGDGPRYVWLSSAFAQAQGGMSSGAPVAIWRADLASVGRRVWITEGNLKGCVAAHHLPAAVVAVAGVSVWRTVPGLLGELLPAGGEVVVAFDADASTNAAVRHHRDLLASSLRQIGYRVLLASWDLERGKGLDDLLLAGATPDVRAWSRALPPLSRPRGRALPPLERPRGVPLPAVVRPRGIPIGTLGVCA